MLSIQSVQSVDRAAPMNFNEQAVLKQEPGAIAQDARKERQAGFPGSGDGTDPQVGTQFSAIV